MGQETKVSTHAHKCTHTRTHTHTCAHAHAHAHTKFHHFPGGGGIYSISPLCTADYSVQNISEGQY